MSCRRLSSMNCRILLEAGQRAPRRRTNASVRSMRKRMYTYRAVVESTRDGTERQIRTVIVRRRPRGHDRSDCRPTIWVPCRSVHGDGGFCVGALQVLASDDHRNVTSREDPKEFERGSPYQSPIRRMPEVNRSYRVGGHRAGVSVCSSFSVGQPLLKRLAAAIYCSS